MAVGDQISVGNKLYTPINKNFNFTTTAVANAFQTVLSITGSGYISKMLFACTNTTYPATVRVTIDGVVVWLGTTVSTTALAGFLLEEYLHFSSGAGLYTRHLTTLISLSTSATVLVEYPYTANVTNPIYAILASPIQFRSSLLIEYTTTNTPGGATITVLGGIA
jgi:hypothetical protein